MPRPMQVQTWREFGGEEESNAIDPGTEQGSLLQNLYVLPHQKGLVRRKGTVPLGVADLVAGGGEPI